MALDDELRSLVAELREMGSDPGTHSLFGIVVPTRDAWAARAVLTEELRGADETLIDFDREVVAHLVAADWDRALADERADLSAELTRAVSDVVVAVADRVGRHLTVVANLNVPMLLPDTNLAPVFAAWYVAAARGRLALVLGGKLRDGCPLLHDSRPLLSPDQYLGMLTCPAGET